MVHARYGFVTRVAAVAVAVVVLVAAASRGEQFKAFGDWRVHYIAFNASLLSPEVAEQYGIVRGRNKGLLNVTAVAQAAGADDGDGGMPRGSKVAVEGRFLNLLGQARKLDFREIDDGGTFYYLAAFDFDDGETLRFEVSVELPGMGERMLRFQQPLYFARP